MYGGVCLAIQSLNVWREPFHEMKLVVFLTSGGFRTGAGSSPLPFCRKFNLFKYNILAKFC